MARSFSHPTTAFEIVESETPPTVDGFAIGEPTGIVECLACGESHLSIDEIGHANDCRQRFVKSRWWVEKMRADGGELQ